LKILILLSRVPYPTDKGDKLRAYNHLRCLARNNELILCALNHTSLHPDALRKLKPFCSQIHILRLRWWEIFTGLIWALFTGKPMQVGYFYNFFTNRKVQKLVRDVAPDHIFCQLLRTAEYVRDLKLPKTLDYQDVFSAGYRRMAEKSGSGFKYFFLFESKRLASYESSVFADFTNKTIISRPDRDLIEHPDREEIAIIPNGVDSEYFSPVLQPKDVDLVFTGNMHYPPNVDAACFLVKEILPLLHETHPGVKVLLAGANPHPKVLSLRSDNVSVSGWVDDIRSSYARARIFIAPMQIGTGLQNKLLEAMAMGIPCITSPLANSALGAIDGTEILVGFSTGEYAAHITRLLGDAAFSASLATKGREFVLRNYDWSETTGMLLQLMSDDKKG
jgi:polysaccharide biosynthesis protein PslH